MSIDSWQDNENAVHTHSGILSIVKKIETIKFEGELIEMEIIVVRVVSSNLEYQTPYVLSHMQIGLNL